MRAVILSNPGPGESAPVSVPNRFSSLVQAIQYGGIAAVHWPVGRAADLRQCLTREQPEIVFSAAYHTLDPGAERENVHGLLERAGIAYIGSSEAALELVLSKAALKDRWRAGGLSTPDYCVVSRTADNQVAGMDAVASAEDFPYLVKPSREGNSRGIGEESIVFTRPALVRQVEELLGTYDEILVEQYLGRYADIREFTIALIGSGDQGIWMPCEIVLTTAKPHRIVTTRDKDEHHTRALPVEPPGLRQALIDFSRRAFSLAGVRDYSRCDVIFAGGQLYAIEINGQPMVPDKWFEACTRGVGLGGAVYLNAIFLAGISRNIREGKLQAGIPDEMRTVVPPEVYQQLCRG